MTEIERLREAIRDAINAVESYAERFNAFDNAFIASTLHVLRLLRDDVAKPELEVRERVLRAFKDVCTSTAVHWEDSTIHQPLFEVYHQLEKAIPSFTSLELLRGDFGKGTPI